MSTITGSALHLYIIESTESRPTRMTAHVATRYSVTGTTSSQRKQGATQRTTQAGANA